MAITLTTVNTLTEIQTALALLSPAELALLEANVHHLLHKKCEGLKRDSAEARFDGKPLPPSLKEFGDLLDELDALPPFLNEEEARRFDSWHATEKQRQKAYTAGAEKKLQQLFT